MTDIAHNMGQPLTLSPTGDLATASLPALTVQRVLRRLLTNPGDYLWELGYGGGLGRMIGQPANAGAIRGVILAQMLQEVAVAQDPQPTVTVRASASGVVVATVQYTDAATGQPNVLTVPIS